jgi:hypothetical protein
VATAVMIVVTVSLVAVTAFGVLRLGAAVDERGQAQTAADAAALGGAEAVREGLPARFAAVTSVEDLEAVGRDLTCGAGREGAVGLAAANRAEVTSYCYDSFADRVEVTVVNRATGDPATGPATASAVASLGLLVDDCELPADASTPAPSPPPDGGDEPEEPGVVELVCGDVTIGFERSDDGGLELATDPDDLAEQLEDALEPRLVE